MVLPDVQIEGVLIIPTFQRATLDLVNFGSDVAKEKDELLEKFFAWAERVCVELERRGLWGDYVDPCSGAYLIAPSAVVVADVDASRRMAAISYPEDVGSNMKCSSPPPLSAGYAVRTPRSRVVYPEVDACETLLRYRTYNAGGCKVLSHPQWGTSVYPATMFARGPIEEVQAALMQAATANATESTVSYTGERQ